jgi:hypothetical protein
VIASVPSADFKVRIADLYMDQERHHYDWPSICMQVDLVWQVSQRVCINSDVQIYFSCFSVKPLQNFIFKQSLDGPKMQYLLQI